jgi:hypothetical protein
MISIITPIHKNLPWWNIRLYGVCTQTYRDWEYIILDNSEQGFAEEYVRECFATPLFDGLQDCRDKIKVYHEPFSGIGLADGRIGKLKNRCVELTTCSDNDIIFTLDYDDFLNTRSLEYIADAVERTDADIVNADFIDSMAMDCDNGDFFTHKSNLNWCNADGFGLFEKTDEYKALYESDKAFREYADNHVSRNGYILNKPYEFRYDNVFRFYFYNIRKACEPWTLFNYGCERFIGKKKVLKEVGGYYDRLACEDLSLLYKTATLYDNVYIPYPYLIITTIINAERNKINTLCSDEYTNIGENQEFINMMGGYFKERHDKFGLEPITQNEYKIQ